MSNEQAASARIAGRTVEPALCFAHEVAQGDDFALCALTGLPIDRLGDLWKLRFEAGVLLGREPVYRRWLGIFRLHARRPWVATVWFQGGPHHARRGEWVVEVHSPVYEKAVVDLVGLAASRVPADYRLVVTAPREEALPEDFDL